MSLVKEALNIPYTRWWDIEPLFSKAKDSHEKEVLKRMIDVKRKRLDEENGNRIVATQQHH